MGLIDFMLNLAGLLLWLNWCTAGVDPLARPKASTLLGTLKPAEPTRFRRWPLLVGLGLLLVVRAFFYWQLGPPLNWDPALGLGAVVLPFRSGFFAQTLLFSVLSFVRMFVLLYVWLVFLWLIARSNASETPVPKLIRLYLGPLATLPALVQLVLPGIAGAVLWVMSEPLLARLGITVAAQSVSRLLLRAFLIGTSAYITLRYLVACLLIAYLVNSYVYVGTHSVLKFVEVTGVRLLSPVRKLPLRFGKIDLAPVVGIATVLFVGEVILYWLPQLYSL